MTGWIFLMSAAAAMAYPLADPPKPVLDKPEAAAANGDWLASTSYLFNHLRVISHPPLVPVVPTAAARPPGALPALVEASSRPPGFQYDLNLDGTLDEFLPLPLPSLLGAPYSPDRTDTSRLGLKVFALPTPTLAQSGENRASRQLWLEALSVSQNIDFVDVGAMARGQSGLIGKAEWAPRTLAAPATPKATPKMFRVPDLPIGWLAVALGGALILWQRRLSRRTITAP
jgi:hypothetical protein